MLLAWLVSSVPLVPFALPMPLVLLALGLFVVGVVHVSGLGFVVDGVVVCGVGRVCVVCVVPGVGGVFVFVCLGCCFLLF